MHDDKAVSLAILMADAFSRPTADCIDDIDKAVEGKKVNWAATKGYGAVSTRCTVTGENTFRTMTLWKSQETLDENVDKIRALATSASGMSPTSGMKGPLAVELD